jgi:hypothetical protein
MRKYCTGSDEFIQSSSQNKVILNRHTHRLPLYVNIVSTMDKLPVFNLLTPLKNGSTLYRAACDPSLRLIVCNSNLESLVSSKLSRLLLQTTSQRLGSHAARRQQNRCRRVRHSGIGRPHACVSECVCVCVCVRARACIYMHVYRVTDAHTHTYTHTN